VGITQPRGQQGRQYDQEQLEARLREALVTLMAGETTFRDLSVARIIEAAGVARSTFYTYYEDKVAMVLSLGVHSLHRLYRGQREWLGKGPEATRDDIALGMRQLLEEFLEDEVILAAVTETAAYDRRVRSAYLEGVHDYGRAIARMIRAGQRAGRMRVMDAAATGEALAWMCERTVSVGAPGATPAQLDATAEALADVISRALFD
jgi:AcrR family transcriptional regulator